MVTDVGVDVAAEVLGGWVKQAWTLVAEGGVVEQAVFPRVQSDSTVRMHSQHQTSLAPRRCLQIDPCLQQICRRERLNSKDDINEYLAMIMRDIFARSQEFEAQGSGWSLEEIINLQLHIVTYEPLSASFYIPPRLQI